MTRPLSTLLRALMLAAFVLAACQTTPPAPTGAPGATPTPRPTRAAGTPTPSPTPTAVPTLSEPQQAQIEHLRGLRIRFLHPWTGERATAAQALADAFNDRNPWDIVVAVEAAGSSSELYAQALARLVDPETAPDVIAAAPEQIAELDGASAGGALLDLTDYAADPDFGLGNGEAADFAQPWWNMGAVGEERLGIPALGSLEVLVYNQTWAQELGYKQPPATPDQFREQVCKASQANHFDNDPKNDGTGGWIAATDAQAVAAWAGGFGSPLDPQAVNGPGTREALAFLNGLVDDECAFIPREPLPYGYFAGRMALAYSGSFEDIREQMDVLARAGSEDEWTVLPYPAEDGPGAALATGDFYAVTRSSASRQLAAWLFARWMAEPEQAGALAEAGGGAVLREGAAVSAGGPPWTAAFALAAGALPAPTAAEWRLSGGILREAVQQIYQPETKPEDIPAILQQVDDMAAELRERAAP